MSAQASLAASLRAYTPRVPTRSDRASIARRASTATRAAAHRDEPAAPAAPTFPRRAALALAAGLALPSLPSLPAALADEPIATREFDFKTYKLAVPSVYDEVNIPLKDPATGTVSPTVLLLKDTRPGQAGNTISLSKQTIPEGGISSVRDIGTPAQTVERLVAAESARSKGFKGVGGAGAAVRDSGERTGPGGLVYYTAEYSKSVLGVQRVVLTTVVVADGQLYTLTAEEDEGRFESEMGDALRATVASFEVVTRTPQPVAQPEKPAAWKKGGKRR